jgi:hypothetical protein
VLWTTEPGVIALDDVSVQLGKGTASLDFADVDVFDWITVANSLQDGAVVAGSPFGATMSVSIRWSNITRVVEGVSDATNGYQGDYLETEATIDVSVANANGFTFSGSGDASSGFAEIGHEQNGGFFGSD